MTTRDRLVQAAATLLDTGGEAAVTLRAVGQLANLSHNAPYKHFKNRPALLAAVATADIAALTAAFAKTRDGAASPTDKLLAAIGALVDFSRARPARYQLAFGAPMFAQQHPELQVQMSRWLGEIVAVVELCQTAKLFPDAPTKSLASLLLSTLHGLVFLETNGQLRPEKGLASIEENMALMIDLFARAAVVPAQQS